LFVAALLSKMTTGLISCGFLAAIDDESLLL
jgi:hypothetical protein